ncbi:IS3 family transposase [Pseudomonas sp. KU26590]|uniref:IS3 family transposase n=1 Tax=Pseudomonas sp. KU26590 TaxID=2991051 RepID=UPI0039FC6EC9
MGVNRSSFYAWRQRQGVANRGRARLRTLLVRFHKESRGSAGARTLASDLRSEGHQVGRYMARTLMRESGVVSCQRRPHKYKSSGVEALVAPHPPGVRIVVASPVFPKKVYRGRKETGRAVLFT